MATQRTPVKLEKNLLDRVDEFSKQNPLLFSSRVRATSYLVDYALKELDKKKGTI